MPVQTNTRLRIATRIHFALLRHLGEGIDVGTMLKHDAEAREVLWVCDASGDDELVSLARQYRRAVELEARAAAPVGHAPQETAWYRDTSGFGVSKPPEDRAALAAAQRQWLKPASWFHR